jgi:hypothetical protein
MRARSVGVVALRQHGSIADVLAACLVLASAFYGKDALAQTTQPGHPVPQPQRTPASPPTTTYSPDNGDSVVVGFPNGAVRAPVVTGPLQNGSQPPPTATGSNSRMEPLQVQKRGLKPQCTQTPGVASALTHAAQEGKSKAMQGCPPAPHAQKPTARAAGGSEQ